MISVIINTYNRLGVLRRCLEALDRQREGTPGFEVVVVDDGSTDGTCAEGPALCDRLHVPARFLAADHGGPAAARNLGIAESSGDLVVFLGDDILVDPGFIRAHADSDRGPDGAAVLGRTFWHPDLKVTPFMALIERNGWQFGYGCMVDPKDLPYTFFYTSNLSLPRSWLADDRFDEGFRDAAYEDIDLGYRLSLRGLRIVHNPDAVGYHYHPYTFAGYAARRQRVAEAAARFHRKYPEVRGARPAPDRSHTRAARAVRGVACAASCRRAGAAVASAVGILDRVGIGLPERCYLRALRLMEDLKRPRPTRAARKPTERTDAANGRISVIIPNHNGLRYLQALLPTVRCQTGVRLDVTVVDDSSTDPKVLRFLGAQRDLRVIQTPRNVGFAGACNLGIRSTDGQYVFILNNDTELAPDCLRTLQSEMERNAAAGVVGCTVLNRDGSIWTSGGRIRNGFPVDLTDPISAPRDTEHLAFCAVLLRRSALSRVGPLDERYFMKFEDVDFSERLRRRTACRIRVLPVPKVTHTGVHASLTSLDGLYYRERNRLLFQRKFYPEAAVRNAFRRLPRRLANNGLVFLKRLCLGRLSDAGRQVRSGACLLRAWADGTWGRGGPLRRP